VVSVTDHHGLVLRTEPDGPRTRRA
jgi:hypothetical protein